MCVVELAEAKVDRRRGRAEMQGGIQWPTAVVLALTWVQEWECGLHVDARTEKTTFASYCEMLFWS